MSGLGGTSQATYVTGTGTKRTRRSSTTLRVQREGSTYIEAMKGEMIVLFW